MASAFRFIAKSAAVRNALSLSLIQFINLVTPLVTLPYVLRVLDTKGYGKVVFYQAVVQYFSILIDFGFQLSATRKITLIRHEPQALARYCSTIQTCKFLLAGLSGAIALLTLLAFPGFLGDWEIFLACLASALGTLLIPMWLFAGLERIAVAALAIAVAKISAIPLTFAFINGPNDAWRFAFINSLSLVMGGVLCLGLIWRWRLVERWSPPSVADVIAAFRDSWHYFLTVAAATFYSATNPVLLGTVSTTTQVAYFGAADRIRTMSLAPLQPISSAYYPVLSRLFATDAAAAAALLRRLTMLLTGGMAIVAIAMFIGAPTIVGLFMGDQYRGAVPVLRIMAALPLVIGLNTALGPLAMLAMGLKKQASAIILICGLANLALLSILGHAYGAIGAAMALLATEIMVSLCLVGALRLRAKPSPAAD